MAVGVVHRNYKVGCQSWCSSVLWEHKLHMHYFTNKSRRAGLLFSLSSFSLWHTNRWGLCESKQPGAMHTNKRPCFLHKRPWPVCHRQRGLLLLLHLPLCDITQCMQTRSTERFMCLEITVIQLRSCRSAYSTFFDQSARVKRTEEYQNHQQCIYKWQVREGIWTKCRLHR